MNNDIKEKIDDIFWEVKKHPMDSDYLVKKEEMEILLDYIVELENKITNLQKCYCNRTDCSGRIKDSKKYESLQQKINKAIEKIDNVEEHCTTPIFNTIGFLNDIKNTLNGGDKDEKIEK